MKVYLLWGTVHCINHEILFGIFAKKEDCLKSLKYEQNSVGVETIEFHMQEYAVR